MSSVPHVKVLFFVLGGAGCLRASVLFVWCVVLTGGACRLDGAVKMVRGFVTYSSCSVVRVVLLSAVVPNQ